MREIKTKFSVGDKVHVSQDVEWRGDWCKGYAMHGFEENDLERMDLFGSPKEDTIKEILIRQEPSLNGERVEVYYKTENQGDMCIREDILESMGESHSDIFKMPGGFMSCNTFYEIEYETEFSCIDVSKICAPLGVLQEVECTHSADSTQAKGLLQMEVMGIWYTKEHVVMEMHRALPVSGIPNVYLVSDNEKELCDFTSKHFVYTGNQIVCTDNLNAVDYRKAHFGTFKEFFDNMKILIVNEFESDPSWI